MVASTLLYSRIALYTSLFLLLVSYLDSLILGARYIKYALPPFLLVLWLARLGMSNDGAINFYKIKDLKSYVLLIAFASLSLVVNYESEGMKDIYFIIVYISPFLLFGIYNSKQYLDISFAGIVGVYLLKMVFSDSKTSFSLISSTGVFESTEAFVFGIYFLYYLSTKQIMKCTLAFVFIILSLKRIVVIGVSIGALVIYFENYIRYLNFRLLQVLVLTISCLVVLLTYLFALGYFDELIFHLFGVSSNYLSMGRLNIYQYVINQSGNNMFFGNGIGSTYSLVQQATYGEDKNLHNDFLKIFIEGGLIIFLSFFYFWSKYINIKTLPFYLYILCLFGTDNVLIYPQVMFFGLYIIIKTNIDFKSANEKL
ncbi:O-antigen ligase family protein [Pseudocolwellia agarivorans]|uniref:O-antigen ligase family protein n=1 Tax=Pseudocolwellia agarivorans TaxID=1911682 RepID=UPI003F880539